MKRETALLLIQKHAIKEEITKKRDYQPGQGSTFGNESEKAKAVLLTVENDIQAMWTRFKNGESIYTICPELEQEEDYDKES